MISFDQSAFQLPYQKTAVTPFSDFPNKAFFMSFTDSMRFLLHRLKINKKHTILLPDFYCPETILFFQSMARVRFYNTKNSLEIDITSYFDAVESYRPDIIINYSYVGFSLTHSEQIALNKYVESTNSVVVEDYAHRILSPSDIKFNYKNHIYIDSIRKQFSLLGSHIVANFDIKYTHRLFMINIYAASLIFENFIKHIVDIGAHITKGSVFNKLSDILFDSIDSRIGSSEVYIDGPEIHKWVWDRIDKIKYHQHVLSLTGEYHKLISRYYKHGLVIPDSVKNCQHALPYFPVFIPDLLREKLKKYLSENSIKIDKLWEYPHGIRELNRSLYDSLMVFPMGMNISVGDISSIQQIFDNFFEKNHG